MEHLSDLEFFWRTWIESLTSKLENETRWRTALDVNKNTWLLTFDIAYVLNLLDPTVADPLSF